MNYQIIGAYVVCTYEDKEGYTHIGMGEINGINPIDIRRAYLESLLNAKEDGCIEQKFYEVDDEYTKENLGKLVGENKENLRKLYKKVKEEKWVKLN